MATKEEKIAKVEEELKMMQETLTKYGDMFNQDGQIDSDEQKQLDKMQTVIKKIEAKLVEMKKKGEANVKDSANPKPLAAHTKVDLKNVTTQKANRIAALFKTGTDPMNKNGGEDMNSVSHNDVDQGSLGDCYFMSAIAAVAKSDPKAIKNLISGPDKNGNYKVKLYVNKTDYGIISWRTAEEVTITPEFLVDSKGNPLYAGKGDGELWVMLIEKAYAILRGKVKAGKVGYTGLEGGFGEEGIEVLTGQEATMLMTTNMSEKDILAKITSAITDKRAITAGTYNNFTKAMNSHMKKEGFRLWSGHEYYILDCKSNKVKVRNPHNDAGDGGREVTLSISDFKMFFDEFCFKD